MSSAAPSAAPPGWYPDPGGERLWRLWSGTDWSPETRPYAGAVVTPSIVASLTLITTLHRLVRYGIVAFFAGLGLVVNVLAHWPGTAHPAPLWFTTAALNLGIGLLMVGSLCFSLAARELEGHWSIEAIVPGVNVLVVGAQVTRRLAGRSPRWRVLTSLLLLALYISQSHANPWLGLAPALMTLDQLRWTSTLIDRLAGPPLAAT
ncbi:MAG: DUF2510 domain-containing protein [Acidimicrobiales bacterium]